MHEAVGAVRSPRRPGFNSRRVGMGFMVNGVILGHVSLLVSLYSTVIIIPLVLCVH